ncbi:MAG: M43 family zinc metalloprotease [Cryomorphaceae bacterium]|nr:T9SS type A sorting domain-containing protein [Flavobacteriales bacterium]
MNKGLLAGAAALIFSLQISAQEGHVHGPWCASDVEHEKLKEQYPSIAETERAYREELKAIQEQMKVNRDDDLPVLRIPMVFHVLHDRGPENISDAQVFRAVQILNEQFRKLRADTALVIPEFKDIHSDTRIEFVIANRTPEGECTNGINRIPTIFTDDDRTGVTKLVASWPRHIYLNVWVVRDIMSDPTGVGTTLGYATLPSGVDNPEAAFLDGIVILNTQMGDIGTGSPDNTTLAHEVGHILNLIHTWGNGQVATACGDDGLADTPETPGRFNCPTPQQAMICNEGVVENYQNYMDYSSCTHMFTEDQATLMRATLNSNVADRSYLVTDGAHALAGIDSDEPEICNPRADFYANRYSTCTSETVSFSPYVTRGTPDTYVWSFPGGEPSSSEESNPSVTYNTEGWKTVTLTVGNESGTDSKTDEFAIYVQSDESVQSSTVGGQDIITENFWEPNHINNGWTVSPANENPLVSGVNWAWSPIGSLDQGSIKLNLFDAPSPERYRFVSPPLDLTGKAGQSISFRYAYATQANPNMVDISLRVYSTSSCFAIRQERFAITDPLEILTGGNSSGQSFEPNNPSLWKTAEFVITNQQAVDGIQYEFEVRADFGANNFYIDNFTIGSSLVSVEDEGALGETKLFPNPASDFAQLELKLNTPSEVSVRVFDITGKQVQNVRSQMLPTGLSQIRLETGSLGAGMYTVKVLGNGIDRALKLVVQP